MIKLEARLSNSSLLQLEKDLRLVKKKIASCKEACAKELAKQAKKYMTTLISQTTNSSYSTGALKKSIYTERSHTALESMVRLYTNLYYAQYVEYGTGQTGRRTNNSTKKISNYRTTPWSWHNFRNGSYYYVSNFRGEKAHLFMFKTQIYIKHNYKRICAKVIKEQFRSLS